MAANWRHDVRWSMSSAPLCLRFWTRAVRKHDRPLPDGAAWKPVPTSHRRHQHLIDHVNHAILLKHVRRLDASLVAGLVDDPQALAIEAHGEGPAGDRFELGRATH